jgi:O-antigen ligase
MALVGLGIAHNQAQRRLAGWRVERMIPRQPSMLRARVDLPRTAALLSVCALGCGAILAFAGVMATDVAVAAAGAALATASLVVLTGAGWLDPMQLLVFSLPLPALYSSESARAAPALLVSGIVLIAWLLGRGADARPLPWRALPWRSSLLLMLALIFAAALSQYPLSAVRELINWCVLLAVLFVAITELKVAPARVRRLALIIAGVAAVCGSLALLETIGVIPARFTRSTSTLNRAALGFGWPNELGMFMAMCLPFSVYARDVATSPGARVLARVGLAATVIGLVSTFSRGSWLAVLVSSLLLLFVGERRFVVRIWVSALIAGLILDIISGGAIRDRIVSTVGDWVVEQRAALTLAGLVMFRAHPLTGVGPGGFANSLEEFGPGITWLWEYLPTAQNVYVQMAAEAGMAGILALLVFLGSAMRVLLRGARAGHNAMAGASDASLRRALLWAFGIACAVGFVEWTFAHGTGQLIVLIAAMGFALDDSRGRAVQPTAPSVGHAAAVGEVS